MNADGFIDGKYYRRNHVAYPLVTSVNHTIALWQSGNLVAMCGFVRRAMEEVDRLPNGHDLDPAFLHAVSSYLSELRTFLLEAQSIDDACRQGLRSP
ncbi:MAG: hypothetical protein R3B13_16810 [Polyangiaceae bacterium]